MYKAVFPPPADVGWSMNDGGISAVGRRRLEYELWKILTVGWEYQLHKPSLSIMWWTGTPISVRTTSQLIWMRLRPNTFGGGTHLQWRLSRTKMVSNYVVYII